MSRTSIMLTTLAIASSIAVAQVPDQAVISVAHIDFLPTRLDAVPALTSYIKLASHDPNILSIHLFQQIGAPNHYTLVETFRSHSAYDAQIAESYTLRFRTLIAPALGSPYDERLDSEVSLR